LLPPGAADEGGGEPGQWAEPMAAIGERGGGSSIRLLTGEPDFAAWKSRTETAVSDQAELATHRKAQAKGESAKPTAIKTARKKAAKSLPIDLVASLTIDNGIWQKQGWERPPGSVWVDYVLPADMRQPVQVTPRLRRQTVRNESAALLALDGEGKQGLILPHRSRGVPLASALHATAVKIDPRPVFTGCDEGRQPLRGPHPHAHWIPLCLAGGPCLDHVLVYAPGPDGMGWLDGSAVASLGKIKASWSKKIKSLNVTLVGVGSIEGLYRSLDRQQQHVPELASGRWC